MFDKEPDEIFGTTSLESDKRETGGLRGLGGGFARFLQSTKCTAL